MIPLRCVWATLAALTLWIGGCGSPCAALAQRTCGRVGESDPLCHKLREIVAEPRAGDDEGCQAGIEFVDELRRGR